MEIHVILNLLFKYLNYNEGINIIFLNKKYYNLYINNIFLSKNIIQQKKIPKKVSSKLNNYQKYKWILYKKLKKKYSFKNNIYKTPNPSSIYEICLYMFNYNKKFNSIWDNLKQTKQFHQEKEIMCQQYGNYGYSFHSLTRKQLITIINEIAIYNIL